MEAEEKARVVASLKDTLRLTKFCHDTLINCYYTTHALYQESVILEWANGQSQEINVTHDSGIAIIKDVMRSIEL